MQRGLETSVAIAAILVIGQFKALTSVNQVDAGVVVNVVEQSDLVQEKGTKGADNRREVPKHPVDANREYVGLFNSDCSQTMLLTPQKKTVELAVDDKIVKHGSTSCHWNVIGTEDCVPVATCKKFRLQDPGENKDDPCAEEYLEITDGSYGFQKYCGKEGPDGVTSGRKLREFYITLKLAGEGRVKERMVKCSVTCSQGKISGKVLDENSEPNTNEDCNCGRKPNADRIVGGEDAKRGEFPWVAALVGAGTRKPFCTGTVINDRIILTAAHCLKYHVDANKINVLLYANRLNTTNISIVMGHGDSEALWNADELAERDRKDNSYRFTVDRYFIHPLFDIETFDFDYALIKLGKPIDWKVQKEVAPVCFPRVGLHSVRPKEGDIGIVAGWGTQSEEMTQQTQPILQKISIPVISDERCNQSYVNRVTKRMFCGGFMEGGKGLCWGDSGAAFIMEKSKQVWEAVGYGSWGDGCVEKDKPIAYVNTREGAQWVRYISNMEDATWCHGN